MVISEFLHASPLKMQQHLFFRIPLGGGGRCGGFFDRFNATAHSTVEVSQKTAARTGARGVCTVSESTIRRELVCMSHIARPLLEEGNGGDISTLFSSTDHLWVTGAFCFDVFELISDDGWMLSRAHSK